jgi:hypothetical protein
MSRRTIIIIITLCFITLGACSETTTPSADTGTVAGFTALLLGGELPSGVTVVLMTDSYEVIRVTRVEADGVFEFTEVPAGALRLYVLHEHYVLAEPSRSRIDVPAGGTLNTGLMLIRNAQENYDYRITGHVTNADTGLPVLGVWVAPVGLGEAGNSIRYLLENGGVAITVTDETGYYSLARAGAREGDFSPVEGLGPISCGREGYLSRTFAGEGPDYNHEPWMPGGLLPTPPDSNLVIDIALVPVPADGLPGTGTVRGVIVHDGEQQAGVQVTMTLMALADRDTVFDPTNKVVSHESTVLSGDDGSFEFNMLPGFYALRAGLLPDDGWTWGGGLPDLEVVAGEILDVSEISVNKAISPVSPYEGEIVTGAMPTLSWTPYPGADSYRVILGVDSYRMSTQGTTSETHFDLSGILSQKEEARIVRWKVFVLRELEPGYVATVSQFELPATFKLEGVNPGD